MKGYYFRACLKYPVNTHPNHQPAEIQCAGLRLGRECGRDGTESMDWTLDKSPTPCSDFYTRSLAVHRPWFQARHLDAIVQ